MNQSRVRNSRSARGGFTLVEVALALMVIGIGMMAVFGLFSASLTFDKESKDDTYAAFFAEDILNSLRAAIPEMVWDEVDDKGKISIWSSARDNWLTPAALKVEVTDTWRTNKYINVQTADRFPEYAIRYKLLIRKWDDIGRAVLEILPGEYGPTNVVKRFYIEFPNANP